MFALNKENILTLIFFMFPVLLLSVPHVGSFLYLVIGLIGIYIYFKSSDKVSLNKNEKIIIYSMFGFFILSVFSVLLEYLNNGYFFEDANDKLEKYLKLGAAYLIFVSALKIERPIYVVKYAFSYAAIVYGLYSIFDKFYFHELARGITHHLVLGNISNTLFATLVIFIFYEKKKNTKLFLIFAAIAAFTAMMLSGARGAWVALPILLLLFFFVIKERRKTILVTSSILIFTFVVMYLLPFTGVEKRINDGYSDIKVYMQGKGIRSIGSRFEMWRSSVEVIKTAPVFGVGVGGYRESVLSVTGNKIAARYYSPHNLYLNALVTQGAIGLVSLLLVLFAPVIVLYKYTKSEIEGVRIFSIIAMTTSITYSIYGLTNAIFDGNAMSMFYVYMMVMVLVYLRRNSGDVVKNEP